MAFSITSGPTWRRYAIPMNWLAAFAILIYCIIVIATVVGAILSKDESHSILHLSLLTGIIVLHAILAVCGFMTKGMVEVNMETQTISTRFGIGRLASRNQYSLPDVDAVEVYDPRQKGAHIGEIKGSPSHPAVGVRIPAQNLTVCVFNHALRLSEAVAEAQELGRLIQKPVILPEWVKA
jgi:hypothetical protein